LSAALHANLLGCVTKSAQAMVGATVRPIFEQPVAKASGSSAAGVRGLRQRFPKAVVCVRRRRRRYSPTTTSR